MRAGRSYPQPLFGLWLAAYSLLVRQRTVLPDWFDFRCMQFVLQLVHDWLAVIAGKMRGMCGRRKMDRPKPAAAVPLGQRSTARLLRSMVSQPDRRYPGASWI